MLFSTLFCYCFWTIVTAAVAFARICCSSAVALVHFHFRISSVPRTDLDATVVRNDQEMDSSASVHLRNALNAVHSQQLLQKYAKFDFSIFNAGSS